MSQTLLFDHWGNPLVADPGVQFGPELPTFGPKRFEHQPAYVRSRGRKQKAGNKTAIRMLERLKKEGRATDDDLASLKMLKRGSRRKSRSSSSSSSSSGRSSRRAGRRSSKSSRRAARKTYRVARVSAGGRKARRSARRYQARLMTRMSRFQSLLGRSSLGKKAASRLRRRLARCGDNQRLGSRSKISRKHARALRRELRRCQGRKIRASSLYAGLGRRAGRKASRRLARSGASRRLARSGGGSMSYAKLMKRLRGTKMKAWVCVGPKRTGCGGGKKGKRGARVWGILRP